MRVRNSLTGLADAKQLTGKHVRKQLGCETAERQVAVHSVRTTAGGLLLLADAEESVEFLLQLMTANKISMIAWKSSLTANSPLSPPPLALKINRAELLQGKN